MKKSILVLVLFLAGCQVLVPITHPATTPQPSATIIPSFTPVSTATNGSQGILRSELFKVSLVIPTAWKRVDGYIERYQGVNGFVSLDAKQTEDPSTIQAVCEDEVNHVLHPYGSSPEIHYVTIDNQDACLILPSQDQNPTMENAGEIVVRYPKPVIINGSPYSFLQILTRKDLINSLIGTIKLDETGEP